MNYFHWPCMQKHLAIQPQGYLSDVIVERSSYNALMIILLYSNMDNNINLWLHLDNSGYTKSCVILYASALLRCCLKHGLGNFNH